MVFILFNNKLPATFFTQILLLSKFDSHIAIILKGNVRQNWLSLNYIYAPKDYIFVSVYLSFLYVTQILGIVLGQLIESGF